MIRPRTDCPFIPPLGSAGLVLASILLAACAGAGDVAERTTMNRAEAARNLMSASESGLLIKRWRVEGRSERIAAALMKHGTDANVDADTSTRLARNGFRLVRIPAARLETLRDDLGGTSLDAEGSHGQSYDWRDIASWPVGDAPCAVAVDGRVRRFQGGQMKLMMRGWTIPMEDGPALHVDLRPEHDRTRPTRLDQMLGTVTFEGERFDALAVELLLEAGSIYVLTSETPGVEWSASGVRSESNGSAPGPAAPAPLTIGERLFCIPDDDSPVVETSLFSNPPPPPRDLLLLIPKIPAALFPPELQAAGASGRLPRTSS